MNPSPIFSCPYSAYCPEQEFLTYWITERSETLRPSTKEKMHTHTHINKPLHKIQQCTQSRDPGFKNLPPEFKAFSHQVLSIFLVSSLDVLSSIKTISQCARPPFVLSFISHLCTFYSSYRCRDQLPACITKPLISCFLSWDFSGRKARMLLITFLTLACVQTWKYTVVNNPWGTLDWWRTGVD